jgi:retron-type reverse transcriptase
MKRYGALYDKICSFENLLRASYRARQGKRFRPDVAAFHFNLERNLFELQDQLRTKSYAPGPYHAFYIQDPKRRLISATPYRDRIVHHALCQVIEPLFEQGFIYDSYANRVGKGTHKALDRGTYFARRNRYALKCDIEKYFPSIDHKILGGMLKRKIKCRDTLWLIERIIDNSNPQEEIVRFFPGDDMFTPYERRRGIPIGNLTSQFFANVYLDGFDHFVKQELRFPAYVRFADDFLVFSDDKKELSILPQRIQERLDGLRIRLHPRKCFVTPVRCGVPFLGWHVYPDRRKIRRPTGVRFQRRLKELMLGYNSALIPYEEVHSSVMSWIGHLKHGNTVGLRSKLLYEMVLRPVERARCIGAIQNG